MSVTLEQVAQWHDEQGHNGLWYVMQVVSQLLDPRTSEFTAAFVGRLVSTLISKAGRELGENLDQILRAILSKMQQAETLSVMQVRGQWGGGLSQPPGGRDGNRYTGPEIFYFVLLSLQNSYVKSVYSGPRNVDKEISMFSIS